MEELCDSEHNHLQIVKPRCVNLDWLEVFCFEPISVAHDTEYFINKGYRVELRDYGTRVYNEMFTIFGTDDYPLIEIRRNPKSSTSNGGILPINACHIRLTNRTCYYHDAAEKLKLFLSQHDYTFMRISRVDVCLDFERFDSGDWPAKFLRRYIQEKFAKINQANISSYGQDCWTTRQWDSISWGREKSDIGTKMYNKTKQLQEVKDKPYIRQAWFACGLVDNPETLEKITKDGSTYKPQIWRVEFSVRSSVKGWFVMEIDGNKKKKQSIRNTLDMWNGREQLFTMFCSLARHYFRFKIVEKGVRKDLCKDKILFKFSPDEHFYKVERLASPSDRRKDLERLLTRLQSYKLEKSDKAIIDAINIVSKAIEEDNMRRHLASPFSKQELLALQLAIGHRKELRQGDNASFYKALLGEIVESDVTIW